MSTLREPKTWIGMPAASCASTDSPLFIQVKRVCGHYEVQHFLYHIRRQAKSSSTASAKTHGATISAWVSSLTVTHGVAPFLLLLCSNAAKAMQLNADFFLYLFVRKTRSRFAMRGPTKPAQRDRFSAFLTLKSGAPQGA